MGSSTFTCGETVIKLREYIKSGDNPFSDASFIKQVLARVLVVVRKKQLDRKHVNTYQHEIAYGGGPLRNRMITALMRNQFPRIVWELDTHDKDTNVTQVLRIPWRNLARGYSSSKMSRALVREDGKWRQAEYTDKADRDEFHSGMSAVEGGYGFGDSQDDRYKDPLTGLFVRSSEQGAYYRSALRRHAADEFLDGLAMILTGQWIYST